MESVFGGAVFNKIMTAETEPCHRHAVDIGDEESERYFKALIEGGHKYVSIDGNNTSSTFNAYLDNQFPVYTDLDPATRGRGKKRRSISRICQRQSEMIYYIQKS